MTDESTVLNNLRTAHYGDWGLDLTSQEVHELWADIEAKDKRVAELEAQLEERIDQFITHYNDAVSAGKVSVDVKRELTDAVIEELGAQEAERLELRKILGWAYDLDEYKDNPEERER